MDCLLNIMLHFVVDDSIDLLHPVIASNSTHNFFAKNLGVRSVALFGV